MEFRGNTPSRFEFSVHTQLTEFSFKPGENASSITGFFKSKDSTDKSKSLEEFVACVIKDKPANIDRFFSSYVVSLYDANHRLEMWLRKIVNTELAAYNQELAVGPG